MLEQLEALRGFVREEGADALVALEQAAAAVMSDRDGLAVRLAELEGTAGALEAAAEELEQVRVLVKQRDADVAALRGESATATAQVESIQSSLGAALAAYRDAVRAQVPTAAELIDGESVEAINASLERARGVVAKVEEAVKAKAAAGVPAGAPGRTAPDFSELGPLEKIRQGLASRNSR